jgi:hypothetical protein
VWHAPHAASGQVSFQVGGVGDLKAYPGIGTGPHTDANVGVFLYTDAADVTVCELHDTLGDASGWWKDSAGAVHPLFVLDNYATEPPLAMIPAVQTGQVSMNELNAGVTPSDGRPDGMYAWDVSGVRTDQQFVDQTDRHTRTAANTQNMNRFAWARWELPAGSQVMFVSGGSEAGGVAFCCFPQGATCGASPAPEPIPYIEVP